LAGEKQRNPASAAPAGAKPARSSAAPEPNESSTKPDYTGRRTAIDRDNRAVEGNACERRQACSLADLRKRASPFGYPRERVFRQAARVRCGSNCLADLVGSVTGDFKIDGFELAEKEGPALCIKAHTWIAGAAAG
jgi:hypothetical protein